MISTLLLRNARVPTLALQVDALADFGTIHVCIPQAVCERLKLEKLGEREVVLADGAAKVVSYVGPLEVRFKNRAGFFGALVIGDQVVLGAIAMGGHGPGGASGDAPARRQSGQPRHRPQHRLYSSRSKRTAWSIRSTASTSSPGILLFG